MRKMAIRQPEGFGGGNGGEIPVWDLSDLYRAETDPRIAADLSQAEADALAFAAAYQGKIAGLSGPRSDGEDTGLDRAALANRLDKLIVRLREGLAPAQHEAGE